MEELNFLPDLASYGALGAVAIYFMFKDYKLNKEVASTLAALGSSVTEALNDFRLALELLRAELHGGKDI